MWNPMVNKIWSKWSLGHCQYPNSNSALNRPLSTIGFNHKNIYIWKRVNIGSLKPMVRIRVVFGTPPILRVPYISPVPWIWLAPSRTTWGATIEHFTVGHLNVCVTREFKSRIKIISLLDIGLILLRPKLQQLPLWNIKGQKCDIMVFLWCI